MNKNVKIAKELVKLAKVLVGVDGNYISDEDQRKIRDFLKVYDLRFSERGPIYGIVDSLQVIRGKKSLGFIAIDRESGEWTFNRGRKSSGFFNTKEYARGSLDQVLDVMDDQIGNEKI